MQIQWTIFGAVLLNFLIWNSAFAAFGDLCNDAFIASCERKLSERTGFFDLVHQFHNAREPLAPVQCQELVPHFYSGVAYFGLFQSEASVPLKCEYAERAMHSFNLFLSGALSFLNPGNTETERLRVLSWMMRQGIYSKELEKVRNCQMESLSESRIDLEARNNVKKQISDLVHHSTEGEGLSPIYAEVKKLIELTGQMLTKIQDQKADLESVSREIRVDKDRAVGFTAKKLADLSSGSVQWQAVESSIQTRQLGIDKLKDYNDFVKWIEEERKCNDQMGSLLSEETDRALSYFNDIIVENPQFLAKINGEIGFKSFYRDQIKLMQQSQKAITLRIQNNVPLKRVCNAEKNIFYCPAEGGGG